MNGSGHVARLLITGVFACLSHLHALEAPQDFVAYGGDRSVVLHWKPVRDPLVSHYAVERSTAPDSPFIPLCPAFQSRDPASLDLQVTNGQAYYYQVKAVAHNGHESAPTEIRQVIPCSFTNDDQFLSYLQKTAFHYFWYRANPENGLIPDRTSPGAPCSVAAVGFGLTAVGIGIDHGWISRALGRERVLRTLRTFHDGPQNSSSSEAMGYKGWYYHFLDSGTALRYTRFHTELSTIDTALLLAGAIYAREYFDRSDRDEREIRRLADALLERVDWKWMADRSLILRMGWQPDSGFLEARWTGYNEAAILYLLAVGAERSPLARAAWKNWTATFEWGTNFGYRCLPFPPLFGHQYSQCWLDLRQLKDDFMRTRGSTYFENSRLATLAQRAYCVQNPGRHVGYGGLIWGLTACDGPNGYRARGAPPALNDDGTIAPTAAGGSIAFAPEVCIPTLRGFYEQFRANLWTPCGFADAFNLGANWWASDVLGIDQGPILIMIENYRTQGVWHTFMKNEQVQRGLRRAGFQ